MQQKIWLVVQGVVTITITKTHIANILPTTPINYGH